MTVPAVEERPVILITTVDIGNGKSDRIELKQGDDPSDAARAFCLQHGIPETVVGPLTDHILDNLRKANDKLDTGDQVGKIAAQLQECLLEEEEEGEDSAEPGAQQPSAGDRNSSSVPPSSDIKPQKLSFSEPTDQLYQQLSSKLLPVENNSRLLSVSASIAQPLSCRTGNSNRASMSVVSEREYRKSQSADTSPRVHQRLYKQAVDLRHKQEAKRRQAAQDVAASMTMQRSSMSWISQEMMKDRSCGPFENYGEMLYAEGLEAAAARKAKADAIRAERDARELEGATFNPEITRLAAALWAGDDVEAQPAWARLSARKKSKTLERIREMKAVKEQQELMECTFKPKINKYSSAMMQERTLAQQTLNLSTHEQLFADAVRRQQKMEALQSWLPEGVTFRPAINKSSSIDATRRSVDTMGMSQDGSVMSSEFGGVRSSVVDRLYGTFEKTKAKIEEKRSQLYGDVDPATGRALYQPQVGRAPRAAPRNRDGLPIGEYLYASGLEALNRKELVLEAERQAERDAASKPHSTAMSQKLFDRLRAKRFSQIFEYLDTEGDGELDIVALMRDPSEHVDNLDSEVREDVEIAAAIHAEQNNMPLYPDPVTNPNAPKQVLPIAPSVDIIGFSALMDEALLRRRKPRSYLVPSPTSKYSPNHTFQPQINKRSKEMALRMRPPELSAHEMLHHTAEHIRSKLEAARREAELAAMADCTFAPRLNPSVPGGAPVEGRALRAAAQIIAQGGSAHRGASASGNDSNTTSPGVTQVPNGNKNTSPGAAVSGRSGATARSQTASAGYAASAAQQAAVAAAAAAQQQHLAALEAEVEQVLQGVGLAQSRLGALEQRTSSSSAASVVSAAAPAPKQTRATEAMLLDMLASTPQSLDSAVDFQVIDQLHRVMLSEQQTPNSDPAAAAHINTGAAARRTSKDVLANTANLFVVPVATAPAPPPVQE